MSRVREVDLDHAFAVALASSIAFQQWVLAGGRFSRYAGSSRLLIDEQAKARKAKHWWKHWWCRFPDGSESETDIFAVFQADDGFRFALHIENKPADGLLGFAQASRYRQRAALKANDPKWLGYSDFEVILLSPALFAANHAECVAQFDRTISYEDVGQFSPLFAGQSTYELSSEQAASLAPSLREADAGEFANEAQVSAVWAKHGLS